ncbi:MAG: methyltransferase domain-containing protein [Armatimonadetes bacterium]|nr:methyltransferase domain-containing protein [Armatimonadota bacterium]
MPLLASPDTGGPLTPTVTRRRGEEIWEGCLTDAAGHRYPVEKGIPRLLPGSLLDAQRSEIAARDAQVRDYDRMAFLRLFGEVEIPLTRRALAARPSDRVLEAGCGTGRMTRRLAERTGDLVAVDFSFESLRANRKKLRGGGLGHVPLVQADLCHLPFAPGTFDRVVSCQVLEHVPGDSARRRAVSELARVARPGGTLALSAYKHSLWTRAFARKEGAHNGGIPFFRFTRRELRALLSEGFEVQSMTGVLVYIYLARCRKT